MLSIRLTRKGKKNQPFFRIIVIDKRRSARGGRAVEILGFINPLTKKRSLKKERILYWIKNGAKPSATVHNLLVKEKIISDKKINVSKKPKTVKSTDGSVTAKTGELDQTVKKEMAQPTKVESAETTTQAVQSSATDSVKESPVVAPIVEQEKPVELPKTE